MANERPLADHERDALNHLLSGDHPLSAALRDRVERAMVLQDGVCCASIHLWAGDEELEDLTGGEPRRAVAVWRRSPEQVVRLTVAGSGAFSHLEITHEGEETGPRTFPAVEELDPPVWEAAS